MDCQMYYRPSQYLMLWLLLLLQPYSAASPHDWEDMVHDQR